MAKDIVVSPIALPVFPPGVPLAVVVHLVSVTCECLVRGSQLLQPAPTAVGLAIAKGVVPGAAEGPGKESGPRRSAKRTAARCLGECDPLRCQAIDVEGVDDSVPAVTEHIETQLVAEHEEDIRPARAASYYTGRSGFRRPPCFAAGGSRYWRGDGLRDAADPHQCHACRAPA